ncbi:MAG: HAD-IC family P-type ATPase [Deltaproteobacteria bacterium]|nr:HAD-IC family P-type ATPase [Deltaproteobacteria bacterium]
MPPAEPPPSPSSEPAGLAVPIWHALDAGAVARELGVPLTGLSDHEAAERLKHFGPNRIEPPKAIPYWVLLVRQFRSPLIYVLLGAGAVALALGELADALFISAVLLLNALIGFVNEFRADREVRSLASLVTPRARVHRSGRALDVDAECVVPGDLLLLEGGVRVNADVRLVEKHDLRVDESLLSGESLTVEKNADAVLRAETPLAERRNMAFAGSMVSIGRGLGLVVATGGRTEIGAIASQLVSVPHEPPPLLRRMELFARRIGTAALVLCTVIVGVGLARGQPLAEVLLAAIALAVSAIPEGLPVALTVALAVAVSRMARRGVVVRHLPAVEALGSCGVIVTDKTGTLTRNQLTVERVVVGDAVYDVTGVGYSPEGELLRDGHPVVLPEEQWLFRLARAACLANEASLTQHQGDPQGTEWSGDPTDVALLSFGIKAGLDPIVLVETHAPLTSIPFESERRYMATYHKLGAGGLVCVKGAPERVIEMCDYQPAEGGGEQRPLDRAAALESIEQAMRQGYRVLAIADAETAESVSASEPAAAPSGLVLLGLVAMTDPPREQVAGALASCRQAGIRVVMVTGDHATTARSVGERIGLFGPDAEMLTGDEVSRLGVDELDVRMQRTLVVARATPAEKLLVVESLKRRGEFVAVTGDGVNDAPALRRADLGVAMGREGTDVAREAADLIITDDDFSSIVAGVEEGRFAYDNVRKVTYLLVSTGVGEVLTVMGALAIGLPVPFTAVQLLWLNLVTNGIQDVALAFEPGEPGALERPPRPPRQGLFDRMMVERTLLGGAVFGSLGLFCFASWIGEGRSVEEARSLLVQLFVLFEILHIGNSRSEKISMFRLNPVSNPILLFGTLAALSVHVVAIYTPFLQSLLGLRVPGVDDLLRLVVVASPIIVVIEIHKAYRRRHPLP